MVLDENLYMHHLEDSGNGRRKCKFCGEDVIPEDFLNHLTGDARCPEVPSNVIAELLWALQDTNESATKKRRRTLSSIDNSEEGSTSNVQVIQQPLLPTPKLEGKAFEINKEKIWCRLMDDQVSRVGICGTGGVGKTTLMAHIYNKLLQDSSSSDHRVYWVTVSHDFSISKLQNLIAKKIDWALPGDEEGEIVRAAALLEALKSKGKCVIFLDDMWKHFDVLRVGIPKECKLVLTTRSWDVCREMRCKEENIIKVQPLLEEEAWNLFAKELGGLNIEVAALAEAVARECSGLPLAIRVMAGSMRGVNDIHEWRNTLEELKGSKLTRGDMDEVFPILKLSYDRLKYLTLQKCFLYCTLFPEDYEIPRDELITLFIAEGIIDEKETRRAEFDSGHTILNRLENVCLLESCVSGSIKCVKMHDIIRDMAVRELRREGSIMPALIEAGMQLNNSPDVKKWTENLVIVSLMANNIKKIPCRDISRCPNLLMLLLGENRRLNRIAKSFFKPLHKLKVLDFSGCSRIKELPDSVSNLVDLVALLLRRCSTLRHVPSLGKLTELKVLDLNGCRSLSEMPVGVEMLSNLKYLDLTETRLKEIPKGLLSKLSRLQVLKLRNNDPWGPIRVEGREVWRLRKLETLKCFFEHLAEFNEFMEPRKHCSQQSLTDYWFQIGQGYRFWGDWHASKEVRICNFSIGTGPDCVALPKDVRVLKIGGCDVSEWLCEDFSALNSTTQLNSIRLSHDAFNCLQFLKLEKLKNLRSLIRTEASCSAFSNLKTIEISFCHMLKKLFPPMLLPNLHNLETIIVRFCSQMEEIFAMDEEGVNDSSSHPNSFPPNISFNLPKLRVLTLMYLPELKSICSVAVICQSLEKIALLRCPKLKRIPFSDPLPSLQRIKAYPEEWWRSVEWDNLNPQHHFQSLVRYD